MNGILLGILILGGSALIGVLVGHIAAALFIMQQPPLFLPWTKRKTAPAHHLNIARGQSRIDLRKTLRDKTANDPIDEEGLFAFSDGWDIVEGDDEDY